jgi:hypothetical protein
MDSEHLRVAWAHLDPIQVPLEQIQGLLEIYLSALEITLDSLAELLGLTLLALACLDPQGLDLAQLP